MRHLTTESRRSESVCLFMKLLVFYIVRHTTNDGSVVESTLCKTSKNLKNPEQDHDDRFCNENWAQKIRK